MLDRQSLKRCRRGEYHLNLRMAIKTLETCSRERRILGEVANGATESPIDFHQPGLDRVTHEAGYVVNV